MPIIIASSKRSSKAKVALEFANKGYCGSKAFYYHGVKVHILGLKRTGTWPLPRTYPTIHFFTEITHDINR